MNYEQRREALNTNIRLTKNKINMRHYTIWMETLKDQKFIHCNCAGPGRPSTMCCEDYYTVDFNPSEWSPDINLFNNWAKINPKTYWKFRRENTTFLTFLLLLAGHYYPEADILKVLNETSSN
jgi:hypothetical protein